MPEWLLFTIAAVVFSVAATWLAKRALEARVGWVRGPLVSLVVFIVFGPLGIWGLRGAGVLQENGLLTDAPVAIGFVFLVLAWLFAIVLIALITLELMWPARPPVGPITYVREALHRRRRAVRYARIVAIASRHISRYSRLLASARRADARVSTVVERKNAFIAALEPT